jgi:hypothetical protein
VTSTAKGQARVAALVAKARVHQQEVLKPFGENNSRDLIRTLKDLVRQHEHTGLFDSK